MNKIKTNNRVFILICFVWSFTVYDCKSQVLSSDNNKYSKKRIKLESLVSTQAVSWEIMEGKFPTLDELIGNVVLLEFYGVGCGNCVMAESDVNQIDSAFKVNNLKTVIIKMQPYDKEKAQIEFNSNQDYFPSRQCIIDYKEISEQYKIEAFPTFILIDKNGVIRYTQLGRFTKDSKSKMMKEILNLI